jgi:hypothetical protein
MKSNYTTEQVNGILAEWKELVFKNHFSEQDFDKFKKDKGLIPTLEVGWYRYDSEPKYLMYRDKTFLYGFCTDGSWLDKESDHNGLIGINEYTLATTEEVETALKAEATKRGFKEGVTVECLTGNFKTALAGDYYQPNGYDYDQIWMLESTGDSVQLFARGKWAKIAEPKVLELTMSELENKYGCKVKIIKE